MESTRRIYYWLLPLLLLIVLAGVFAARKWQPIATQINSAPADSAEANFVELVELTIDFGTGEPRVQSIPWRAGLTVQDALATAEAVTFSVRDEGAAAFLTELAGQPNEGSGGKNWQFEVNGLWSDRSFGLHELQPGDRVLWEFKESE